ncbi:unnamed protein product, partial [marine sediment metagenome]
MKKIRKKGTIYLVILMMVISVSPLFSAEADDNGHIIIEPSYDTQNSNISIVN